MVRQCGSTVSECVYVGKTLEAVLEKFFSWPPQENKKGIIIISV